MGKKAVTAESAPKAIGPYSQAISKDGFVFVSGQIPADPATGQVVGGDIRKQTEQVLRNIQSVLGAAGLDLTNVVKTTVYMKNLGEFAAMNEVYAQFFKEPYPARATVEVSNLPRDAGVEIEAVAIR